jgi:DNA-binding response OmpR family regulator
MLRGRRKDPEPSFLDGLKVVAVDDDPLVHRAFRRILPTVDMVETHDVNAFISVLDALGTELPDALIVDRALPDGSGFDAVRAVRANPVLRDVVIIATTGGSVDRDRLEAVDSGADEYIPKVSDLHVIPELIERLCRLSGPERVTRRQAIRDRMFPGSGR